MLAPRAACSPSPFTERGLGGEVGEASEIAGASPQVEAKPCTLISCPPLPRRGRGGNPQRVACTRLPSPTAWERGWGEGEKQRVRRPQRFCLLGTPTGISPSKIKSSPFRTVLPPP